MCAGSSSTAPKRGRGLARQLVPRRVSRAMIVFAGTVGWARTTPRPHLDRLRFFAPPRHYFVQGFCIEKKGADAFPIGALARIMSSAGRF